MNVKSPYSEEELIEKQGVAPHAFWNNEIIAARFFIAIIRTALAVVDVIRWVLFRIAALSLGMVGLLLTIPLFGIRVRLWRVWVMGFCRLKLLWRRVSVDQRDGMDFQDLSTLVVVSVSRQAAVVYSLYFIPLKVKMVLPQDWIEGPLGWVLRLCGAISWQTYIQKELYLDSKRYCFFWNCLELSPESSFFFEEVLPIFAVAKKQHKAIEFWDVDDLDAISGASLLNPVTISVSEIYCADEEMTADLQNVDSIIQHVTDLQLDLFDDSYID